MTPFNSSQQFSTRRKTKFNYFLCVFGGSVLVRVCYGSPWVSHVAALPLPLLSPFSHFFIEIVCKSSSSPGNNLSWPRFGKNVWPKLWIIKKIYILNSGFLLLLFCFYFCFGLVFLTFWHYFLHTHLSTCYFYCDLWISYKYTKTHPSRWPCICIWFEINCISICLNTTNFCNYRV